MNLLFKHGIIPHADSIALKSKELASRHNIKLKQWMNDICMAYKIKNCAIKLKKEVTSLLYLPSIPSVEDFAANIHEPLKDTCIQTPGELNSQSTLVNFLTSTNILSTVDTSALKLASDYQPSCVASQVCEMLKAEGISELTIKDTVNMLVDVKKKQKEINNTESGVLDAANVVSDMEAPKGYQIIGDNLDLHLNVRHMSTNNKNRLDKNNSCIYY